MKTFIVLFVIAASLPADAQRVRENIRQRAVIAGSSQQVVEEPVKAQPVKKEHSQSHNAKRKQ